MARCPQRACAYDEHAFPLSRSGIIFAAVRGNPGKPYGENLMQKLLLATAAVLSLGAGTPLYAAGYSPNGGVLNGGVLNGGAFHGGAGQSVVTGGGRTVFTTGRVGNMQTTTLPGGAGQGMLMNNGNGTSTLIGPGTFSTMPTPR
jgi:hypothetical protein